MSLSLNCSSTYEATKDESTALWLRQRVDLILEYKDDCDPLPPPLNVLHFTFGFAMAVNRLIAWLRSRLVHGEPAEGNNTVDEKRGFRIAMGPRVSAATNGLARQLCTGFINAAAEASEAREAEVKATQAWRLSVERKIELLQHKVSRGLTEMNSKLDAVSAALAAQRRR